MTEDNDKTVHLSELPNVDLGPSQFVERCLNNPEGITLFVGGSTSGYSIDQEAVKSAEAAGAMVTHEFPIPENETASPRRRFFDEMRIVLNQKPDTVL